MSTTDTDHLTILVGGCELPAAATARATITADIERALSNVAEAHDLARETLTLTVIGGHAFSSIRDACPRCGAALSFRNVEATRDNAAYAQVACEACGLAGTAVYRLVDVLEYIEDPAEADVPVLPHRSSVTTYGLDPRYTPYE